MAIIKPVAEKGNPHAQNGLGFMYANGLGVEQDYSKALSLYKPAIAQGVADAQYNFGDMYYEGKGVKQDYTEAIKWYELAAKHGDLVAPKKLKRLAAQGFR